MIFYFRLRENWNEAQCHLSNTTTCDAAHTEYRTSVLSGAATKVQASTVVSAVVSSICVVILVILFIVFIYLYAKYNEETSLGRQLKSLQQSYQQFGDKSQSKLKTLSSLELGKKISEKAKATKAKVKPPSNEFVNPHPMVNNNNVITASM